MTATQQEVQTLLTALKTYVKVWPQAQISPYRQGGIGDAPELDALRDALRAVLKPRYTAVELGILGWGIDDRLGYGKQFSRQHGSIRIADNLTEKQARAVEALLNAEEQS